MLFALGLALVVALVAIVSIDTTTTPNAAAVSSPTAATHLYNDEAATELGAECGSSAFIKQQTTCALQSCIAATAKKPESKCCKALDKGKMTATCGGTVYKLKRKMACRIEMERDISGVACLN